MSRLSRIAKAILYRIAAVSQAKVRLLSEKYNLDERDVAGWASIDPTPNGKYLEWLVRRVADGNIRLPEDGARATQALQDFQVLTQKKKTREQYQINPDIGVYTLHDIEELGDKLHGREMRPESLGKVPVGAEKVYDDGEYALLKVTDADTVCELSAGTKWCTSDKGTAQKYLNKGPLYVVYKNGEKIGQTDGYQLMDLRDRPIWIFADVGLDKVLIEQGLIDLGEIFELSGKVGGFGRELEETGLIESILKNPETSDLLATYEPKVYNKYVR